MMKLKLKKIFKSSLAMALVFGTAVAVSGCDKDDSSVKNDDKQYEIYMLAKEAGATDLTYEEWLVSIKGSKGEKGDDGHTPDIKIGYDLRFELRGTVEAQRHDELADGKRARQAQRVRHAVHVIDVRRQALAGLRAAERKIKRINFYRHCLFLS